MARRTSGRAKRPTRRAEGGRPESGVGGSMMSEIQAIVETAIYVDDLDRAEAFYRDVLGLEVIGKEAGRHVFFRVGDGVLLAFDPDATLRGEVLPSHGTRGPGHFALGLRAETLDAWRDRLGGHGVV